MKTLSASFFACSAVELAPKLLGKVVRKGSCTGIIVETEAYGTDPASHAYKITPRSKIMQETYGHWYVYFTYGMHHCANITCDKEGIGAVLIRAVEPLEGLGVMKHRRETTEVENLANGPAKFCEAFSITKKENGSPVGSDFTIYHAPAIPKNKIATSPRIGISAGRSLLWRFYIKNNLFVSKK